MSMKFIWVFLLSSSLVLGGTPSPSQSVDCEGMKLQIRQLRNYQLALPDNSGNLQVLQDQYNNTAAEILFINGLLEMQQEIADFKKGIAQAQETLETSAKKLEADNTALKKELDEINGIVKQGEKVHAIADSLNTLFNDQNLDAVIKSVEQTSFDVTNIEPRVTTIYEALVKQVRENYCNNPPDDEKVLTLCDNFDTDYQNLDSSVGFDTSKTIEDVLRLVITSSLTDGKKGKGTLDKAKFKDNISKFKKLVPTDIKRFGEDQNKKFLMELKGLTQTNHSKVIKSGQSILLKYNDYLGKQFPNMNFAHADEINTIRKKIDDQIKANTGKIVEYREGKTIVPESPKFNFKDLFKPGSLLDLHFKKNNTTWMDLDAYKNRSSKKAEKYEGYIKGLVERAGCEYKADAAVVTQCLLDLEDSTLGARRNDLGNLLKGLRIQIDAIHESKEYQAVDYMINLLANKLLKDCTNAPGNGKVTFSEYNNPNSCTNLIFQEGELGKIPLMADDVELIIAKLSDPTEKGKEGHCQVITDDLKIELPIVKEVCKVPEVKPEQCTNDKIVKKDDGSCSDKCVDTTLVLKDGDCVKPTTPTPAKCEKENFKTNPDGSCADGCIDGYLPIEGQCVIDPRKKVCDKPNFAIKEDGSCAEACKDGFDLKNGECVTKTTPTEPEVLLCPDGKTKMLPGVTCPTTPPITEDSDGVKGCAYSDLEVDTDGKCTFVCKDSKKTWDAKKEKCVGSADGDYGNNSPAPVKPKPDRPKKCSVPNVAKRADGSCADYCIDIDKYRYDTKKKECVRRDKKDRDSDKDDDENKYGGRRYYRTYDTDKFHVNLKRDPDTGLDYIDRERRQSTTSMFFQGLGRTFYPRSMQGMDMGASWTDFYGMYNSNNYMMNYNANLGYWGKQLQAYPPPQYGYPYPQGGAGAGYWGYNQGAFYRQNYYTPNIPSIGSPISF